MFHQERKIQFQLGKYCICWTFADRYINLGGVAGDTALTWLSFLLSSKVLQGYCMLYQFYPTISTSCMSEEQHRRIAAVALNYSSSLCHVLFSGVGKTGHEQLSFCPVFTTKHLHVFPLISYSKSVNGLSFRGSAMGAIIWVAYLDPTPPGLNWDLRYSKPTFRLRVLCAMPGTLTIFYISKSFVAPEGALMVSSMYSSA